MEYEGVSLITNQIETFGVKNIVSHYADDDVLYIDGGTPMIASTIKPSGFDVSEAVFWLETSLEIFHAESEGKKENIQNLINWLQAKI